MSLDDYLALREEEKKTPKPVKEETHIRDIIFEYGFGYSNKIL